MVRVSGDMLARLLLVANRLLALATAEAQFPKHGEVGPQLQPFQMFTTQHKTRSALPQLANSTASREEAQGFISRFKLRFRCTLQFVICSTARSCTDIKLHSCVCNSRTLPRLRYMDPYFSAPKRNVLFCTGVGAVVCAWYTYVGILACKVWLL